jgi:hypothetical protein
MEPSSQCQASRWPSFCAELPWDGHLGETWLNLWSVVSCGDDFTDHCCGDCFGAEALEYARASGTADFVDAVVVWMNHLRWLEGRDFDAIEHGFLRRVFRDDPQLANRMAQRIYAAFPQLRH